MKNFVIGLLNEKLPAFYYYHDYHHTLYVTEKALQIGYQERCTEAEMNLLEVAALWHDTGYILTYDGHEEAGCELARQYLPGFGFSEENINKITGMIMATKIPQSPKNKLEAIIADADLEYLGTSFAAGKANDLFRELQFLNPALTKEQWNQMQISFIQQHHYFTEFCLEKREPVKAAYLRELENKV
jgi:HD superfamily phosphodiesterase